VVPQLRDALTAKGADGNGGYPAPGESTPPRAKAPLPTMAPAERHAPFLRDAAPPPRVRVRACRMAFVPSSRGPNGLAIAFRVRLFLFPVRRPAMALSGAQPAVSVATEYGMNSIIDATERLQPPERVQRHVPPRKLHVRTYDVNPEGDEQ